MDVLTNIYGPITLRSLTNSVRKYSLSDGLFIKVPSQNRGIVSWIRAWTWLTFQCPLEGVCYFLEIIFTYARTQVIIALLHKLPIELRIGSDKQRYLVYFFYNVQPISRTAITLSIFVVFAWVQYNLICFFLSLTVFYWDQ